MQLHMQADGMTHKKLLRGLIVALLFTSCFTSFLYVKETSAGVLPKFYVDDDNTEGPWDGSSVNPFRYIQDAIDNASAGDRIYILEGTYTENLIINSSKTSLNLFGEDASNTIITGDGAGDVLTISATGVDISDLTIKESGANSSNAAVKINASNCVLVNNLISDSSHGIYVYDCDNTKIYYNTLSGNSLDGIHIRSSRNNNITYSTMQSNGYNGIFLYNCSNNRLENNTVSSNTYNGIYLNLTCNNNTIANNYIASNTLNGIYLNDHCNDNIIRNHNGNNEIYSNSNSGIRIENSSRNNLGYNNVRSNYDYGIMILGSNNTIHNSTISYNTKHGIFLFGDDNTNILSNTIQNNTKDGIRIQNSTSDELYRNDISGNIQYGLYLNYYAINNLIYNNYFHDNTENAYDMSENNNIWNVSSRIGYSIVNGANDIVAGNYWDDFDNATEGAEDSDEDGIADSGYSIDISSTDNSPILDTVSPSIGTPSASPNIQTIGSYTYISVSITDNTEIEEVRLSITYPNSDTSNISITQYKTGSTYYYNHQFSTVGNYSYRISARDPRNWASSSTKTFEINEGQAPTITDNSATTSSPGSVFVFNATVTDDTDSASDLTVKVDWEHGSNSGNYSMANVNGNYFVVSAPLDNSIALMNYVIYAVDQWGNAVTTASKSVTITDSKAPEITITKHDYSSSGVFNTYTVRAEITDDHTVVNTTIEYWYQGSEHQTAEMDEKSNNIYEKIIYLDKLVDVYCLITTEDPSGNQNDSTKPISDTGGAYTGIIGVNVAFSGSDSFDLDGNITEYLWDFGDGTTETGEEIKHKYLTNGNYTITLTVTDDDENTDIDTTYVKIIEGTKIEPSASTISQIEQLYNITLEEDFFAYDTDADDIVDTFIDLNNILTDVKGSVFELDDNSIFLISMNDTNIPEFMWNATADTITTIKEEKSDNVVPVENGDTATATVTIDKNDGWICLHINDEYSYASLTVKAGNTEISEDRIWRRDNRIYVLDDPVTQYQFIYDGIIIPETLEWVKFTPQEDSTIGKNNPTIKIEYNVAVTVEYADFLNPDINNSQPINIINLLETNDYKTYTYTPDNNLPSGEYEIYLRVRDEEGNWKNSSTYYNFVSYEKQGFDIFSIVPYIGAMIGIFVAAFFISKKFKINLESFVYIKNRKILPFFKPVVFGPLSLDVNEQNISKAEFYVNGELKDTLTQEPYTWKWDESAFMKQKIETKVYDQQGNSNSSGEMTFYVFNPKIFK